MIPNDVFPKLRWETVTSYPYSAHLQRHPRRRAKEEKKTPEEKKGPEKKADAVTVGDGGAGPYKAILAGDPRRNSNPLRR